MGWWTIGGFDQLPEDNKKSRKVDTDGKLHQSCSKTREALWYLP